MLAVCSEVSNIEYLFPRPLTANPQICHTLLVSQILDGHHTYAATTARPIPNIRTVKKSAVQYSTHYQAKNKNKIYTQKPSKPTPQPQPFPLAASRPFPLPLHPQKPTLNNTTPPILQLAQIAPPPTPPPRKPHIMLLPLLRPERP